MNLIVLEEPPVEPVTLQQCYDHLRLTPDPGSPVVHPDDAMLTRQIRAARADCQNTTRRSFVKQRLRFVTGWGDPYWPFYSWGRSIRGVELQRPPVLQVLGVSYYNADNTLTLLDPASYYVTEDEPPRLMFVDSCPAVGAYHRQDALRIDYWAGYPTQNSPEDDYTSLVPEPIKGAILLGVELQYEALSPEQRTRLEQAQASLLTPYTVMVAV